MSVLSADRKESRLEAIVFAEEGLYDIILDLLQRSFGIRDLDHYVRLRYAYGKDATENFEKYRYIMTTSKNEIMHIMSLLTNNLRTSNSIYPTSMYEYDKRREYQNIAIANCEQLIKELQRIVRIFEVDLNIYGPVIKAINREIGLIKKWRQKDNRIKSYLQGGI